MKSKKFGSYELIEHIASGGMADIYLARSLGPSGFEKKLIIKVLRSEIESQKDFVQHFQREARVAATLRHPNIVDVYDFGEIKGKYYLAMEYVQGSDLAHIVETQRSKETLIPRDLAIYIVCEVLKGLHHAHDRRGEDGHPSPLVHRDVSLANILISKEGHIKITDFGIVKILHERQDDTMPGIFKGKSMYASPEQIRTQVLDPRSDLYSVGIVLFVLLTNELPYDAQSHGELLHEMEDQKFRYLSSYQKFVPEPMKAVLQKALAFSPKDRFQSANHFMDALSELYTTDRISRLPSKLESYIDFLSKGTLPPPASSGTPQKETVPSQRKKDQRPQERANSSYRPGKKKSKGAKTQFFILSLLVLTAMFWNTLREKFQRISIPEFPSPVQTPEPNKKHKAEPEAEPTLQSTPKISAPALEPTSPPPTPRSSPTEAPAKNVQSTRLPARRTPAPKKRVVQEFGYVTIFPQGPFALVEVDGESWGETPIVKRKTPIGSRRFQFKNPKLQLQREMVIEIKKGQTLTLSEIWNQ